jgi:hypothetical protein
MQHTHIAPFQQAIGCNNQHQLCYPSSDLLCMPVVQVNIYCDCPLWPDDSMCSNRACSVCECGANEVPMPWLAAEQQAAKACKATQSPDCDSEGCE